ncbi:hypothetical protein TL16_g12148, partial [Triparma laevis f. inornata]
MDSRSQAVEGGAVSKKKPSVAEQSPPETSGSSHNPIHEAPKVGGKSHPEPSGSPNQVPECHTVFSVLTFCVSSMHPLLHFHAYLDEYYQLIDKNYGLTKFEEFWSFNFTPLTFWALLISFMLQPSNESKWHKAMLYVQYAVYSFSFTVSYFNFFGRSVVILIVTIVLLILLFFATLKVRNIVASRDPEMISGFLVKSVIYKGLLLGTIKLTFLVFTSIKCETELWEEEEKSNLEHPWRDCNRTLYSQTGLGIMIIIYLTLSVLSGIASTSVLEDHTVTLKKAWTMDMDFAESVQCCGIFLSAFLAIYLAGNYGAEGDFRSELDQNLIYLAAWIGSLSLLFSHIPAAFVVWKEEESEKLKQKIAALKVENAKLKAELPSEEPLKKEEEESRIAEEKNKILFNKDDKVEAKYGGKSEYLPVKIACVHEDGTVDIDYGTEVSVKPEDVCTILKLGYKVEVNHIPGEIMDVHEDGTVNVKYNKELNAKPEDIRAHSPFCDGLKVEAKYGGESKYMPRKITCVHKNGTVDIDYDKEVSVKPEDVRTLHPFEPSAGLKVRVKKHGGKSEYIPAEITKVNEDGTIDVKYVKELKVKPELISLSSNKLGLKVEAKFGGKSKYMPGKITCVHKNGTFDIDYGTEVSVKPEDVRTLEASPFEPSEGLEVGVKIYSRKSEYVRGKITVVHEDGTFDVKYDTELEAKPEFVCTLEASTFWTTVAFLMTSCQSTLTIIGTATLDDFYTTVLTTLFPFTVILMVGAWFCQPQRTSTKDMRKICLHFASYATAKCVAEEGSLSECAVTATCSTWISIYLLFGWLAFIIDGSVPELDKSTFFLTIEKIAKIQGMGIRKRKIVQGALAFFNILCGLFLFSLMSIVSNNEDLTTIVFVVGIGGGCFAFLIVAIEYWCTLEEQKQLEKKETDTEVELNKDEDDDDLNRSVRVLSAGMRAHSRSLGGYREDGGGVDTTIKEVWSGYIFLIFLVTSTYSALIMTWAFTGEDKWWMYAFVMGPISFLPYGLSILMKPKETWEGNPLYMAFLYFHFASFLVLSEAGAVGFYISNGRPIKAIIPGVRLSGWLYCFWKATKLRKSASTLKSNELSDFLAKEVFEKGVLSVGPCLFFTFETVSCLIDNKDNIEDGHCANTSMASFYLSGILSILLL